MKIKLDVKHDYYILLFTVSYCFVWIVSALRKEVNLCSFLDFSSVFWHCFSDRNYLLAKTHNTLSYSLAFGLTIHFLLLLVFYGSIIACLYLAAGLGVKQDPRNIQDRKWDLLLCQNGKGKKWNYLQFCAQTPLHYTQEGSDSEYNVLSSRWVKGMEIRFPVFSAVSSGTQVEDTWWKLSFSMPWSIHLCFQISLKTSYSSPMTVT